MAGMIAELSQIRRAAEECSRRITGECTPMLPTDFEAHSSLAKDSENFLEPALLVSHGYRIRKTKIGRRTTNLRAEDGHVVGNELETIG